MTLNSKTSVNSVDDKILVGVLNLINKAHEWRGTMTNLSSVLRVSNAPKSPSALRIVLNRIVNRLRTRGVSVKFGRTTDRTRTRFVKFMS